MLGQRKQPTMLDLLRRLNDQASSTQLRKIGAGAVSAIQSGVGAIGLGDLADVDTASVPPQDGNVLSWDAGLGDWVPAAGGGGSLATLSDVDVQTTPPVDGDVLKYDEGQGLWVPGEGGGGTLASLSDVDASSFQIGYTLVYSGSNWYATSRALSNLPDVDLSSGLSSGKVLGYNGSKWIPTTRPTAISGLTDVLIDNPQDDDLLIYDSNVEAWYNRPNYGIRYSAQFAAGDLATATFSGHPYVRIPDLNGTSNQVYLEAGKRYRIRGVVYAGSSAAGGVGQASIKVGTTDSSSDPSYASSLRVYFGVADGAGSGGNAFRMEADSFVTWGTTGLFNIGFYIQTSNAGQSSHTLTARSAATNTAYIAVETIP